MSTFRNELAPADNGTDVYVVCVEVLDETIGNWGWAKTKIHWHTLVPGHKDEIVNAWNDHVEHAHPDLREELIVTDKAAPETTEMDRELVFNEVIYGLTVLLGAIEQTQSENYHGVRMALEYVKSMKEQEA